MNNHMLPEELAELALDWVNGYNILKTDKQFEKFADRFLHGHRTLIQSFLGILFRLLLAIALKWEEMGWNSDLRNEASANALKSFLNAVRTNEVEIGPFPFI